MKFIDFNLFWNRVRNTLWSSIGEFLCGGPSTTSIAVNTHKPWQRPFKSGKKYQFRVEEISSEEEGLPVTKKSRKKKKKVSSKKSCKKSRRHYVILDEAMRQPMETFYD